MTPEEAIDIILNHTQFCIPMEDIEALNIVLSVLIKFEQYQKIGTVEECREAVEKQKPKKPEEIDKEYGYFICGNCGTAIYASDEFESHHYCLNCGQKIQWDENLEGMEDDTSAKN